MKLPMEPIPTDQLVNTKTSLGELKKRPARPEAPAKADPMEKPAAPSAQTTTPLDRAYPWLLCASLVLSAVLCWMYVSKPVVKIEQVEKVIYEPAPSVAATDERQMTAPSQAPIDTSLIPSDDHLPGEQVAKQNQAASVPEAGHELADAAKPSAPKNVPSWEKTNLQVQHILQAETASGETEKIELKVPVRYQSRTLRWTAADAQKAREVLGRLMVYERNLAMLKQEGQLILKDWNNLLNQTLPSQALRADSLSLPYNHGHGEPPKNVPSNAPVIEIDEDDTASQ